ncbi:MAG: hypothetical protein KH138_01655, partial [Firmicutes bacterium]|nr:hypothetical protein [Bacillota bacterium]
MDKTSTSLSMFRGVTNQAEPCPNCREGSNPSFSAKQKTVEFQRFPLILNGFLLFQDVPRST